jgi:transglutaminase-like putative cysteine protease
MEALDLKAPLLAPHGFRGVILESVLLLAILVSVAGGLAEVVQGLEVWSLIFPLALCGLFSAWMLGRCGFVDWKAAFVLIPGGLLIVQLSVGQLWDELAEMLTGSPAFFLDLFHWRGGNLAGLANHLEGGESLFSGLGVLLRRGGEWLLTLTSDQPSFDPTAATLAWGIALWLISAWAGWVSSRHGAPLLAVLPAGLLLSISLDYAWAEPYWLLMFLASTLLLIGFLRHRRRRRRWLRTGMDHPEDVGVETAVMTTLITIALVGLAALSPSISLERLVDFFEGGPAQEGESGRGLAGAVGLTHSRPKEHDPFAAVRAPGLPREHLIGGGPELSEQVVMIIEVEAPAEGAPGPYPYWRGLTYDLYTGRGWRTSETTTIPFAAGEALRPSILPKQYPIRQRVEFVGEAGQVLHVAGDLTSANVSFQVAFRTAGEVFGATMDRVSYVADSALSAPDEEALQSSPGDYPEWVRERYLGSLQGIPRQVLELSRELTATKGTPYERAVAIEEHLRTYTYTLDVPRPPGGEDLVEYFLFDLKKGYCDYFASAMVVMARAAGLPSRLAIGYVSGDYDAERDRYIVSEAEAHSWPEIYFADIGWVIFEPTAARPRVDRLQEGGVAEGEAKLEPLLPPLPQVANSAGAILLGVFLVIGLGIGVAVWRERRRLRDLPHNALVVDIYRRLRSHCGQLPIAAHPGDTPYEFASIVRAYFGAITKLGSPAAWFAPIGEEVRHLCEALVVSQFSPHDLDDEKRAEVLSSWWRLRLRLWIAKIWSAMTRRERREGHRSGV